MYRAVEGKIICSGPRIFTVKFIVNCSCVQKESTKQKEIIHLVDHRTLQNKAPETIF